MNNDSAVSDAWSRGLALLPYAYRVRLVPAADIPGYTCDVAQYFANLVSLVARKREMGQSRMHPYGARGRSTIEATCNYLARYSIIETVV